MKKQYYFISGLPRSGSTLLSALLRQNPNFYANISDSLNQYFKNICDSYQEFPNENENEIKKNIVHGVFDGFYKNINCSTIFNTNRSWTYYTHLLKYVWPNTKIIVCVRDIKWVVNSIESASKKNLLKFSGTLGPSSLNVYERCADVMSDQGLVGVGYNGIKQALYSNNLDMLLFVEYDDLCKNPEGTLKRIYNFIDMPYYPYHDFNNIQTDESWKKFDEKLGIELHNLHHHVFFKERNCVLPIDIQRKLNGLEIWREKYPKIHT